MGEEFPPLESTIDIEDSQSSLPASLEPGLGLPRLGQAVTPTLDLESGVAPAKQQSRGDGCGLTS